ncbi:PREDICTED: uncharacterized protein LOC109214949 [Nicotiana attenuata]|uniref:uncharacterized protein LOC109214949 n=1 Tax=Nicotiana attenuata TaxID=49451 RepID=UPI0009058523|nr:PREDICTED: uncharacterized protein LOC109214949 [Nicotiana attenuata]
MQTLNLHELTWRGDYYTWSNKQQGADRVYSSIDRALGNDEWMQEYGHMEAEYRLPFISDHAPMVISIRTQVPSGKIPFRFFNVWAEYPSFIPLLEGVWKEQYDHDPMKNISQKLKILRSLLKQLNNNKLANEEKQALENLEKWSLIEESILQQKARATWLRLGDANSKYFSAVVKEKRQRKVITELQDSFGNKITDQQQIQAEIISFYKALMGSTIGNLPAVNKQTMKNGPVLNHEQ